MNTLNATFIRAAAPAARTAAWLAVLLAVVLLAGCGSTKVYTTEKTIVYRGTLYNLSNVQKIGSRVEATLPDSSKVNMRTLDKNAQEKLFKDNKSVTVAMIIELDSNEMVYSNASMQKYSDYTKAAKRLDGALNDINKFMADKKKTQLKLK